MKWIIKRKNLLNLFSKKLIIWYIDAKRDLPWRQIQDPYSIWISEIMLQQTKAQTVIPYFKKFIQKYPNIKDLSEANLDDLLHLWSGLGYYQRVKNIHKAAKIIQNQYYGIFPTNYSEMIQIPGIGPYTAGAILSIAFNQPVPILDGNIKRVLARFFGIQKPISSTIEKKLWIIQENLIPKNEARNFNQAIMELGALICQPRITPNCIQCPLHQDCKAFELDIAKKIPIILKKGKIQKIFYIYFIIEYRSQFLIYQKKNERFLNGFWDFLSFEINSLKIFKMDTKSILDILKLNIPQLDLIELPTYHQTISHSIMQYLLEFFLFKIQLTLDKQQLQLEQFLNSKKYIYNWIPSLSDIKNYPRSSLVDKVISKF